MAVNPSASGSWCLSSELGCLFEGEVGGVVDFHHCIK